MKAYIEGYAEGDMENKLRENDKPNTPSSIHTFVLRSGRMTEAQKRDYEQFSQRWCLPFKKEALDLSRVFKNPAPVTLEIGFGKGQATALIAQANPDKNYLGIEVHRAGVGRLLGEIEKLALRNLLIIEHDAIEVLDYMILPCSLAACHVFFPDPWQKKRHHKRRLVRRPRTNLIASRLASGAYLYMATDWEPYAQDAWNELAATPGLESMYEHFAPCQPWRPETRFEAKGLAAKRITHELMFRKKEADVLEHPRCQHR